MSTCLEILDPREFSAIDAHGFVNRLREKRSAPAKALLFSICTSMLIENVLNAKWINLDLNENLLTVPYRYGATLKNAGHVVELPSLAVDLLNRLRLDTDPDRDDFIFTVAKESICNAASKILPKNINADLIDHIMITHIQIMLADVGTAEDQKQLIFPVFRGAHPASNEWCNPYNARSPRFLLEKWCDWIIGPQP